MPSGPALVIRRHVSAARALVFEAWTDPALMMRWFAADASWQATITADVRVGGRFDIVMRQLDGTMHHQLGVYREIVPCSRLVFTWSCPELAVVDSIVTVELTDAGEGTDLVLTHELLDDADIRNAHERGWTGCLNNLERMLRDDAPEGRGT
jgi:uncharacterized protein YndB with AHSA1/START domain